MQEPSANNDAGLRLVACAQRHHEAVRAIFNEAIVNSAALYDLQPRDEVFMREWWRAKQDGGWPVLGLEDQGGDLLGFATYGPFRPHAAYQHTVEHSLYIRVDQRGRGLGRRLLAELVARARQGGFHTMIGVIDSGNEASLRLHRSMGFEACGSIREAGRKFDRWLDLQLVQLLLAPARIGGAANR
jgi:L-amino acid N-acyltransferase YncA